MKKIYIIFFTVFLLLLFESTVYADEVVCNYYLKDTYEQQGEKHTQEITSTIRFKTDYTEIYLAGKLEYKEGGKSVLSQDIVFVNIGDVHQAGGVYYIDYYENGLETLVDYYNQSNGNCPPYLLIYDNTEFNQRQGVPSDLPAAKASTTKSEWEPVFALELLNLEKENESKPEEQKKEVKSCQLKFKYTEFSNDKESEVSIDYTVYEENKAVTSSNSTILGSTDSFFKDSKPICPSEMYVCVLGKVDSNGNRPLFISKDKESMKSNIMSALQTLGENYGLNSYEEYKEKYCKDQTDEECYEDFNLEFSLACGSTNTLSPSENEIKLGDGGCNIFQNYINEINENKDGINSQAKIVDLKQYCSLVTAHGNYSSRKSSCINKCLNISDYLNGITLNSGECGFSKRLLSFISNIVRWIKYIIPVAVIALGMLDFIKSVGADKDDELKKAQGRFVKRLIAAALIFIIPFIIEFVLDKMGFTEYISGCGIIDL